jgi:hypothetical protein
MLNGLQVGRLRTSFSECLTLGNEVTTSAAFAAEVSIPQGETSGAGRMREGRPRELSLDEPEVPDDESRDLVPTNMVWGGGDMERIPDTQPAEGEFYDTEFRFSV